MGRFDRKARGRTTLERRPVPREDTTVPNEPLDAKDRGHQAYYELKTRIHRQLIDRLDLAKLDALPREVVEQQIRRIVEDMLALDETPLSRKERDDLVVEIEHETFGLGPIEPLMQDPAISDILVNGSKKVYVERHGKLEPTRVIFRDDAHLLQVIDRIVSAVGRRVDESSPMVDARLPDGSRVNAIINTERIVTIEDSAELQLQQEHVVRLETRPPNIEGQGAVSQRELLRNALRMRPDRIVAGEVRGAEVLDMLQAMNTGHDGSISTVHANSTRDALSRIETMVLMSGLSLPVRAMRDYVASALDLVIHVSRLSDGTRKVVRVTEIVGMEEDVVTTQDIFTFDQQGIDAEGRVVGFHRATGVRPKFTERLARAGIHLGSEVFDPSKRHVVR